MADSSTPPPPAGVPAHAKNMLRNVLVGVTTTILGTSAVYFLNLHTGSSNSSSAENMLVMKESTGKAWKSYVASDNLYFQNVLSLTNELTQNKNLDEFKTNVLKEIHHFQNDVDDLLKTESMDPSFVSLLKRRAESEKDAEAVFTKYIDDMNAIIHAGYDDNTRNQKAQDEENWFNEKSKGMLERAVNEVEDLSKALTDKYNQPFLATDFASYNYVKKGATTNNNNNNGNTNNTNTNNPNNNNGNQNPVDPNNNNGNTNNTNNNNTNNNNTNNNTTTATTALLTGYWNTTGADIDLTQDGKFTWNVLATNTKTTGTWKLTNNQLYMYPANQGNTSWILNLSNVTPNSFTMQLSVSPFNMYALVRDAD